MFTSQRFFILCALASASVPQAGHAAGVDSSPKVRFVTVQPDVKLEVLDWGGTGRDLVLLAGGGNTAHVFDSLARKLAAHYHVLGITRRGFGQSSAPQSGYDAKRLGDDVVAVVDSLHIADPVLIGHSIAGEELSAISKYHPGRAAALIYLDAGYSFALYNPTHGDYTPALAELKDDLTALQKRLYDDALISKTLEDLVRFQTNLSELRGEVEGAKGPSPTAADRTSIAAYQQYMKGYYGGTIPEAEIRELYHISDSGVVGEWLGHGFANQAVMLEEERFTSVDTPSLAIFSYPSAPYSVMTHDPAKLAAYRASESSRKEAQIAAFRNQPHAKVVVIPNVTHYIFLSDESEIVALIRKFIDGL
jgi:pimeloyl-ACP methyl ester carboxylesterase